MNIVQCNKPWNGPCAVGWYGNCIVHVNMQGIKFHSFEIFSYEKNSDACYKTRIQKKNNINILVRPMIFKIKLSSNRKEGRFFSFIQVCYYSEKIWILPVWNIFRLTRCSLICLLSVISYFRLWTPLSFRMSFVFNRSTNIISV